MLLQSTYSDPIGVISPRTGVAINVAPLFDALEQIDGQTNSPADLREFVRKLIRTIAITVHDPQITSPVDLATLNFELYRLDEMLSAMQDNRQAA